MDFNEAYKFPLQIDPDTWYVWTADHTMAFNYFFDNPSYINQLIRKINGETVPELEYSKPFSITNSLNILDKFGNMVLFARGWGHLIGSGALNLDAKEAAKIQNDFLEYCVNQLNK